MGPPVQPPSFRASPRVRVFLATAAHLLAVGLAATGAAGDGGSPSGFPLSISTNRDDTRSFYNAVYRASTSRPMAWTGSLSACDPGATSADYLTAGLRRVNFFRAMAGVPANVTFSGTLNAKAQKAALIVLANDKISKSPASTAKCYSAEGGSASGTSNIALGAAGAEAVDTFIDDGAAPILERRRWLLFPPLLNMGQGSVDGTVGQHTGASALYLDKASLSSPRPGTRDPFVAWPPRGFIPYPLLPATWSISVASANFKNAAVKVTTNSGKATIPVTVQLLDGGAGDSTLAFKLNPSSPLPASGGDTTYTVSVTNVQVSGATQSFQYDVTAVDPALPCPSCVLPRITARPPTSANTPLSVNSAASFAFSGLSIADGYSFRASLAESKLSFSDNAESGTGGFSVSASTAAYQVLAADVYAPNSPGHSFHLAHPNRHIQSLTWAYTFFLTRSSQLKFKSRLGAAEPSQKATVQVSLDDGGTWQTVFTKSGTGSQGDTTFTPTTVDLTQYASRSILVRFVYFISSPDAKYNSGTSKGVGWYIDDITLANSLVTVKSTTGSASGSSLQFTPDAKGIYMIQLRATAFGGYPLEWGPGYSFLVS